MWALVYSSLLYSELVDAYFVISLWEYLHSLHTDNYDIYSFVFIRDG